MPDVNQWYYSDKVKEHFFKPRNFVTEDPKKGEFNAAGEAGSLACGDIMKVWLKIDKKTERVKEFKWRTWGCATAIASTSMFSEMVTEKGGMKISDALKITPKDIVLRLGGVPLRKFHCSVLIDQAFRNAAENYRKSVLGTHFWRID
ncbi:MAG: iron-sulfur cluster assembly scaffold protein [Candidatus Terrybacteria bacterium]|nr:iron-sulfur cluster assembly scaffold protein [Candidatus Terrybacteria bacterium]